MADRAALTVADATVVITDEHIKALIAVALGVQNGREDGEGITLITIFAAACFQELLERRHAMAAIEQLSRRVDNVFALVQPNLEASEGGGA